MNLKVILFSLRECLILICITFMRVWNLKWKPHLCHGEWNFRSGSSLACDSGCVLCVKVFESGAHDLGWGCREQNAVIVNAITASAHTTPGYISVCPLSWWALARRRLSLSEFTESSSTRPRWGTDGRGSRLTSDPLRSLHAWTQITIIYALSWFAHLFYCEKTTAFTLIHEWIITYYNLIFQWSELFAGPSFLILRQRQGISSFLIGWVRIFVTSSLWLTI